MAIYITSIEKISDTKVKVTVTDSTLGETYTISTRNLTDENGNEISGSTTFTGVGDPYLANVQAIDPTTVRLIFSEPVLDDGLLIASHYPITGPSYAPVAVTGVTKVSDYVIELTVSGEMCTGYSYSIEANFVKNISGIEILSPKNATTFAGLGIAPEVVSATSTGIDTVQVVFDSDMYDTGLTTDGNYAFTCPAGATITVSNVTKVNSTTVDITTSGEMLTGVDNYTVTVTGVRDLYRNTINPLANSDTFNGIGVAPEMSSALAAATPTNKVTVTFNEAMETTSVENLANWSFPTQDTGAIVKFSATQTAPTTVDIVVTGEMTNGTNNYSVKAANVTDLVGNVIDAAHDEVTFNGVGIMPQVSNAAAQDSVTLRITFDENMTNDAAFKNNANYTITGDTVLTKGAMAAVGAGPTYTAVDLTVSEMLQGGNYSVAVSTTNVTDLAGNTVDPGANSHAFTGIGIAPTIDSIVVNSDAGTGIRVTFSEDMGDTGLLTVSNHQTKPPGAPAFMNALNVARVGGTQDQIDITTGGLTMGSVNELKTLNVVDVGGNPIVTVTNNLGPFAELDSATTPNSTTIRAVFDRAMTNNASLTTAGKYAGGGDDPLTVNSVTVVNATTIDLDITGMVNGHNYIISVNSVVGIRDSLGNGISGGSASFTASW